MNALSELSVMQIVHMTLFSFKHKDNGNYVTAPLLFFPPFLFFFHLFILPGFF